MKPLEKIVNFVRIAPHGIIPLAIGATIGADTALNLGLADNLPFSLQLTERIIGIGFAAVFSPFFLGGLEKYQKFKKRIEAGGIDRDNIENNLRWYCERQAYKAAAYSCSLGKEFDEINRNYQDKKLLTWVPEI